MNACWSNLLALLVVLATLCTGVSGLHCYQCTGMTNIDPDRCLHPDPQDTISVECDADSICEKRIDFMPDRVSVKVDRGCTANCAGRTYIYTDDFQVHCCDTFRCNGATQVQVLSPALLLAGLVLVQVLGR